VFYPFFFHTITSSTYKHNFLLLFHSSQILSCFVHFCCFFIVFAFPKHSPLQRMYLIFFFFSLTLFSLFPNTLHLSGQTKLPFSADFPWFHFSQNTRFFSVQIELSFSSAFSVFILCKNSPFLTNCFSPFRKSHHLA
jgi:hypothetical protein